MTGTLWAAVAGAGFGVFQAVNARAARNADSVYGSTFLQLVAAAAVLVAAALATEDVTAIVDASLVGLAIFAVAGSVHFLAGWTLLNLSQARIGAARTSPLLATTPLWGLVLAAGASAQVPGVVAVAGIALTIAGAYVVSDPGGARGTPLRDAAFGLGTAVAWAIGAVLIVEGLERFAAPPLLGVTVGVLAAACAYGLLVLVTRTPLRLDAQLRDVVGLKLFAGLVVGLATWARWLALDDEAVGVVLALNLLSVPVVLLLAPRISGRGLEVVMPRVVGGAALVIAGALLLILAASRRTGRHYPIANVCCSVGDYPLPKDGGGFNPWEATWRRRPSSAAARSSPWTTPWASSSAVTS